MSGDALVLEGVTRAFGALRAVDDVSLSVAAGQKYAVLGSNGAGKTTLFNAITGDFPPTAGRILFFGEDITALPPHERIRKGLRRTYQSSLLFKELSVRDNLFLAVRGVGNGRFSVWRPGPGHASQVATDDILQRVRLDGLKDEL
ncbi:MAG: ATP-binding cassette domain-containing protein, partial [Ideonella sp.]|nr:ATP-binding cassette domain-containing protein [Ideonella sp.]